MRKLSLLFSAMFIAFGSFAAEHDEAAHRLEYSVFRNYSFARMSNPAAVRATQQTAKAMFPGWNATVDKLSSTPRDMFGPAVALQGSTNQQKAVYAINNKLSAFEIDGKQWNVTRNAQYDHAGYVDFTQNVAGHDVVFSHMSFRFTTDGKLVRIKMSNYGQPVATMQPTVSQAVALSGPALTTDLQGISGVDVKMESDWVWFPVPQKNGYQLHPAWVFTVTGTGAHEMPVDYLGYIDATTGELLYRTNRVHETFDVTIKGEVYGTSPLMATSIEPLSEMQITIGGTGFTTNDTGYVYAANKTAPVNGNISLQGPWVRVVDNNGGLTPFTPTFNTSGSTYQVPTGTNNTEVRHLTTFYHVNKIHDYLKQVYPSFTGMDNALTANVDRSGNTCNAFYNGSSINFYRPQPSCRAFSEVSDIIYHEYGHGINYRFYQSQGTSFSNGALGEANSDVWAMSINKDGIVGEGAFTNGSGIRNYTTNNPKVYPQDIRGEVHADGEIVAGAWWDVAVNTGSVQVMADLFALTQYDVPNGPNGTEGEIYHDVLISAIINDDNDNNLANGTPHFKEIVEAFARHGIYLLQDADLAHTEVDHQNPGTNVTISAELTVANPAFFDKLYLHYRNRYATNNGWDTVAMVNTTGSTYVAQIPGQAAKSIMDYYFSAADVVSASSYGLPQGFEPVISKPSSEMTIPYQFAFGIGAPRYKFDFDGPLDGWQIGTSSDNASSGRWEVGVPVGTSFGGETIQPGNDHTTGSGKCLVTGNGSTLYSFADIDNGTTTVMTPIFDLPFADPVIEYYRWFSNDVGSTQSARNDYFTVEARVNENSLLWRRVDYTRQSDRNWRRRIFRLSEFLFTATTVQFRIVAEDREQTNLAANGQDIVEAAFDDFIIYEGSPLSVEDMPEDIHSSIYPNPADNVVNITVPAGSKGSLSMYDLNGKVLQKVDVSAAENNYSFNTSALAPGTYMILVQTQYAVQNSKVVVVH